MAYIPPQGVATPHGTRQSFVIFSYANYCAWGVQAMANWPKHVNCVNKNYSNCARFTSIAIIWPGKGHNENFLKGSQKKSTPLHELPILSKLILYIY